jgi:CDGSH-type Zn-finger protein
MARLGRKEDRGPMEVKVGNESRWICMCRLGRNQPFCDGSHKKTADELEGKVYVYHKVALRHLIPCWKLFPSWRARWFNKYWLIKWLLRNCHDWGLSGVNIWAKAAWNISGFRYVSPALSNQIIIVVTRLRQANLMILWVTEENTMTTRTFEPLCTIWLCTDERQSFRKTLTGAIRTGYYVFIWFCHEKLLKIVSSNIKSWWWIYIYYIISFELFSQGQQIVQELEEKLGYHHPFADSIKDHLSHYTRKRWWQIRWFAIVKKRC